MRRKFAAQVKKKYLLHFNCVNYVRAYFGGFAPCGLSTLLDFGARGSKSTTGQKVSWLKSKIDFDRILHKKSSYSFGMRGFLLICRTFADTAPAVLSLQARLAASCCVQRRRFE